MSAKSRRKNFCTWCTARLPRAAVRCRHCGEFTRMSRLYAVAAVILSASCLFLLMKFVIN